MQEEESRNRRLLRFFYPLTNNCTLHVCIVSLSNDIVFFSRQNFATQIRCVTQAAVRCGTCQASTLFATSKFRKNNWRYTARAIVHAL